MRLPANLRRLARRMIGAGRASAISPEGLRELATREDVLVIAVGMVRPGVPDPRLRGPASADRNDAQVQLPGEQRTAALRSLAAVVADAPRDRAIVVHCG